MTYPLCLRQNFVALLFVGTASGSLLLCISSSLAPLLPVMYKIAQVWSELMEVLSYSQVDVGLVL